MPKELTIPQQKWVEALRSGKYQQGRQQLATETQTGRTYCCLGVLCEVAKQEGVIIGYIDTDSYLPEVVQQWAGLKTKDGEFRDKYNERTSLSDGLNDREFQPFERIADVIESQPIGLFEE